MKITFIKDCPPIYASGNSFYPKGTQADLILGESLVDIGYAREGWEPLPKPAEPIAQPKPAPKKRKRRPRKAAVKK